MYAAQTRTESAEEALERHAVSAPSTGTPSATPFPGAARGSLAHACRRRLEDALEVTVAVAVRQVVDHPDVLEDQGRAGADLLVRVVERCEHRVGDAVAGPDERVPGRVPHGPRLVSEEWDEQRRARASGDGGGRRGGLGAHERMGIVEQRRRAPDGLGRRRPAKGLERGRAHLVRRVAGQVRDVPPGQIGVPGEQADHREADDDARVPEQRHEPDAGTRREVVERRRDSDRRVAVVRERLDEPVDGPLVPVPEGGEGGDAGHADVQLGAAKPAEEQDARLVVVGWRGLERGAPRRGDGGGRVGRQLVATSAKPPDRDRGEQDEPAARDERGDRPEAPPSIHA